MAGVLPDSVFGVLLQNVIDFLKYNYELLGDAEDNFNTLRDHLGNLKGYLQQCNENYSSSILDSMANRVRNLVYRAEDAVETFIVETANHRLRGTFDQLLHKGEYKLKVRNLALEIEKISADVKGFYQNEAHIGIGAMTLDRLTGAAGAGAGAENLRPPVEDTVVGLEDEIAKVIDLLLGEEKELDVISIFGMYGLGKTTLAKKVFNDPRIDYHSFVRAFVEVSRDFKIKEVFLKIIKCFITEDMGNKSDEELAKFIKDYLESRNYLIVLDDVWDEAAWDKLKCAFPNNNKRSRILITTRELRVAEYARRKSAPHLLRFLYEDEARKLLRLKIFNENRCPVNLEELEIRILKKCDGLPLAIVVIAGMLRNHREDNRWWTQVADGVQSYDLRAKGQMDYVIKLSFDRLPFDLKPCFLYLGVFPEDTDISVRTLLRLWVSEGFIPSSNGNMSLEDIAAFYLQNLVDRSLVMVQKRGTNDQIKTIKIHDTLREFCKANAQIETLFREIKTTAQAADMPTDNDRRLCINSGLSDYFRLTPAGRRVRSFLCFPIEMFILPRDQMSSVFRAFPLLRVLNIRSIKLDRFPPDLCYLVLLKYISFFCDLKILPAKMSNLWNLQTLIVQSSARNTLEIRADIWKMAHLRHVETNASLILPRTREESPKNSNLQTLSAISPESCKSEVFDRTPMLKKLGIRGNLAPLLKDEGEFGSLSGLENLENLKLLNQTAEKIRVFPRATVFPSKLVKLTLLNTLLDWKHMSTLGKLDYLQVLKLKDNAFEGIMWNTEDGGFKHLKVLYIGKTNLCVWKASSSHFPVLTRLYLRHCFKLEAIPRDLEGISTLQMIDLYSTNPSLVSSARRFQVAKLESNKKFKLIVYPPEE